MAVASAMAAVMAVESAVAAVMAATALAAMVLLQRTLVTADGAEGVAPLALPEAGELRDLSLKFCPSNLPLLRDDEYGQDERSSLLVTPSEAEDAADADGGNHRHAGVGADAEDVNLLSEASRGKW